MARNFPIYLWKQSKKYGPIMQMKIGSLHILVVSSAKLAKEVLKTQDLAFCSRPQFVGPRVLSYNCSDIVFSPYSEYWREMRKITSIHLFSLKKVQSFRPIREDKINRVVAKISGLDRVNLSEMAMALGSTVMGRVAFGRRYVEQEFQMRRFDALLREAQALLVTFFVSDYVPAISWEDKVIGLKYRLDKTFKNLDSFYQEIIDSHLEHKSEEDEDDIVDVLVKIKEDKMCSIPLSWDHIKALLTDIFVAGTDTSAASVVWTMTALIKAPNVMEKLQSEIRNMIGKKGKVDEDDLPKLPYLKAVINETFRLYPPAPLLAPRETAESCILEGFEIQPKTVVYVNAWAIARDPKCWENADEFLPERFLNNNIDIKGQDFEVIPFGSGRRICPGISMGLVNVELTVANLLYSFDWELPPGITTQDIDTDSLPGLTVHKKNALFLVPKKYVTPSIP